MTGYHVERSMPESARWLRVTKDQVTELTYIDKDLIEEQEYQYRVLAVNKIGEGPPTEKSRTVLAKDPFGLYQLSVHTVPVAGMTLYVCLQTSQVHQEYPTMWR